ncbi:conjugal transfer protein TraG N-terminal domain-containing protein, partial [Enterovibrio norvegicus]|uniref:conjugal transfer protein TraG N-terminal domain-containing protein n=1 Tax=Enterovibrio norvegicus TaxID=188144 RepID=UPI00352D5C19
MEVVIYTIGDHDFASIVMGGVALAFDPDSGHFGNQNSLFGLGLVLALFCGILKGVLEKGQPDLSIVIRGWVLWMILFMPRTDVMLEHPATGDISIHTDIPAGLAIAGAVASQVPVGFVDILGSIFIQPNQTPVSKVDALRALVALEGQDALLRSPDGVSDLIYSIENYYGQCVLRDISHQADVELNGGSNDVTVNTLKTFQDPWSNLKVNAPSWFTNIKIGSDSVRSVPCNEAYDDINRLLMSGKFEEAVRGKFKLNNIDFDVLDDALNNNFDMTMLGATGSSMVIARQNFIHYVLMKKTSNLPSSNPNRELVFDQMEFEAKQQRIISMSSERNLWLEVAPAVITTYEALVWFLAPICSFMVLFGLGGVGLITSYFRHLILVGLYPVLALLSNLYLEWAIDRSMSDYMNSGAAWTFGGLSNFQTTAQTYIAQASYMTVMIPVLAYMILKGGDYAAVQIASRMGSSPNVNTRTAMPGVGAMATSGGARIGQHSMVVGQDGAQIINRNAIQSMNDSSIGYSNSTGSTFGMASAIANKRVNAAGQQLTLASNTMAGELLSIANNGQSGSSTDASHGRRNQKTAQIIQNFSNALGVDYSEGVDILTQLAVSGEVKAGGKFGGVKAQGQAQVKGGQREVTTEKAQKALQQALGLSSSEAADMSTKEMVSQMVNTSDSKSLNKSYQNAKNSHKAWTNAQETSKSIQRSIQKSTGANESVNSNLSNIKTDGQGLDKVTDWGFYGQGNTRSAQGASVWDQTRQRDANGNNVAYNSQMRDYFVGERDVFNASERRDYNQLVTSRNAAKEVIHGNGSDTQKSQASAQLKATESAMEKMENQAFERHGMGSDKIDKSEQRQQLRNGDTKVERLLNKEEVRAGAKYATDLAESHGDSRTSAARVFSNVARGAQDASSSELAGLQSKIAQNQPVNDFKPRMNMAFSNLMTKAGHSFDDKALRLIGEDTGKQMKHLGFNPQTGETLNPQKNNQLFDNEKHKTDVLSNTKQIGQAVTAPPPKKDVEAAYKRFTSKVAGADVLKQATALLPESVREDLEKLNQSKTALDGASVNRIGHNVATAALAANQAVGDVYEGGAGMISQWLPSQTNDTLKDNLAEMAKGGENVSEAMLPVIKDLATSDASEVLEKFDRGMKPDAHPSERIYAQGVASMLYNPTGKGSSLLDRTIDDLSNKTLNPKEAADLSNLVSLRDGAHEIKNGNAKLAPEHANRFFHETEQLASGMVTADGVKSIQQYNKSGVIPGIQNEEKALAVYNTAHSFKALGFDGMDKVIDYAKENFEYSDAHKKNAANRSDFNPTGISHAAKFQGEQPIPKTPHEEIYGEGKQVAAYKALQTMSDPKREDRSPESNNLRKMAVTPGAITNYANGVSTAVANGDVNHVSRSQFNENMSTLSQYGEYFTALGSKTNNPFYTDLGERINRDVDAASKNVASIQYGSNNMVDGPVTLTNVHKGMSDNGALQIPSDKMQPLLQMSKGTALNIDYKEAVGPGQTIEKSMSLEKLGLHNDNSSVIFKNNESGQHYALNLSEKSGAWWNETNPLRPIEKDKFTLNNSTVPMNLDRFLPAEKTPKEINAGGEVATGKANATVPNLSHNVMSGQASTSPATQVPAATSMTPTGNAVPAAGGDKQQVSTQVPAATSLTPTGNAVPAAGGDKQQVSTQVPAAT